MSLLEFEERFEQSWEEVRPNDKARGQSVAKRTCVKKQHRSKNNTARRVNASFRARTSVFLVQKEPDQSWTANAKSNVQKHPNFRNEAFKGALFAQKDVNPFFSTA
jgi:hypothetical protein